jgi:hypothetical protein
MEQECTFVGSTRMLVHQFSGLLSVNVVVVVVVLAA